MIHPLPDSIVSVDFPCLAKHHTSHWTSSSWEVVVAFLRYPLLVAQAEEVRCVDPFPVVAAAFDSEFVAKIAVEESLSS